jgi:hypothetical protein
MTSKLLVERGCYERGCACTNYGVNEDLVCMVELSFIFQKLNKIIDSCSDVKRERGIHQDAKDLATFVIRDINLFIQEMTDEKV